MTRYFSECMNKISSKKKVWISIATLPFTGGALWLYHRFDPLQYALFPPCPFHYTTGLHCPGCGSQRSLHALLHGDVLGALQHNFLLLLLFFIGLYKIYLLLSKKTNSSANILYATRTPWIVLFLVLGFWILRNIPFEPFSYLAP